jgi:uncharacterized protein YjbJ (UPF0337 family)
MNWDTVKGDWKQFQGKVKEQWGKLTDDDLKRIDGRREQLAGAIEKKYGIEKDEAEKQVSAFEQTCGHCSSEGNRMESESRGHEKHMAGQHAMNDPAKEKSDSMRRDSTSPMQPGGERMKDSEPMKDKEMAGDKHRENKPSASGKKEHSQAPRAKK